MAVNAFTHVMSTASAVKPQWSLQPSGSDTYPSGLTITDGTPIHLVWTCDGANARLYVNGSLAETKASTSLLNAATGMFAFGTGTGGSAQFFTGSAGWARIYNDRALTAAQIALNYKNAKTVFPALP